jgi:N-acetyl-gamma-glutamylphosphate reductase
MIDSTHYPTVKSVNLDVFIGSTSDSLVKGKAAAAVAGFMAMAEGLDDELAVTLVTAKLNSTV